MIDAGRVGNNAAGRSSGFAIDQAHNIRAKDFAGVIDAEREQLALNRAGQGYLRKAVQSHRIPCDWDEAGKIHAAATDRGASKLKAYAKTLDLLDAECDWLDADQMKGITGSEFYVSSLYTPGTILVH